MMPQRTPGGTATPPRGCLSLQYPPTLPCSNQLIPSRPTHLCDDGTSQGTAWQGPTDTHRRICYYCRQPLHRNLSKGDAQCNACYTKRYHAQLPRVGCASHCSYCFPVA